MLSRFFLTTSVSHLALGLVGMHSAAVSAASMWSLTKSLNSSLGVCVSDIS